MTDATQAIMPVTQSDRDLYSALIGLSETNQKLRFMGKPTIEPLQLIARHRQAHTLPGDVGMREALERISKLTPFSANAATAEDFAATVHAIADTALAALTPAALSGDAGEGELPADVRRLVIAARTIAFNDWDGDSEEWTVARKELDDASEAFAGRVPWENE